MIDEETNKQNRRKTNEISLKKILQKIISEKEREKREKEGEENIKEKDRKIGTERERERGRARIWKK